MGDAGMVLKGIEAAKEMVEKLEKAFNELESRRESSMPNKTQWEDIKKHICNLEKSLKEKHNEVEEKERILEEKQSEACKVVAEREAAVVAKELASLNRLQELKDAAVSAIVEARMNCKAPTPMLDDVKGDKDNKVSTSTIDEATAPTAPEKNLPDVKSGDPAEPIRSEVKLHPQLKELCEQMDAKGLLKMLSNNRKVLATISEELTDALKSAPEPARLVLDTLEGFYPPASSNSQQSGDNALQSIRRACHVILEAASPLLGMAEPGNDQPVSSEIKQQARGIADEWKAKLAGVDIDASNGYSLEAIAFLQLLATFRIAEEFHEDELCKLVLAVSRRRQTPELCRCLGLTHRMPGMVESLAKGGKQIDAVHFAYAFQLTESFSPVNLLKEHLNNAKQSAQESNGATGEDLQKDANDKELGALKAVIKCIAEHKLQDEYPVEPLKLRVAQIEKAKNEKKRKEQAAKNQAKKPRSNGGGYVPRKSSSVYNQRGVYPSIADRYSERYPYAAAAAAPPLPAYNGAAAIQSSYSQQPNVQRPYHYGDERVAPAPAPAPTYNSLYPDERVAPVAPVASTYSSLYQDGRVPASAAAYGSSSTNYGSYGTSSYGNYGAAASGYQSSAATNYGSYMGSAGGVQSASPNYGSYMSAGTQPPHKPSYM